MLKQKVEGLLKKTAIQNGMWMYALQIFNTIIPLLTLPYITRILGNEGYGTFAFALNIIGYLQVLIEYGFPMSATRKVVAFKQNKEKVSYIFSTVLYARLILLGISILILSGIFFFVNWSDLQKQCMVVLFICLIGSSLQQDWLFQGLQEMKYISIISIVGRTISVALIFAFVKQQEDLLLYCLLYGVSTFLSGIIGIVLVKKMFMLTFLKLKIKEIFKELQDGFYVFTTSLSSKVFGTIGVTFLGIFSTDVVVGVYAAIQKIPQLMLLAWAPINQVLYPITSQKMQSSYSEGKKFAKKMRRIFIIPFFLLTLLIGVFHTQIVGIAFGSDYVVNAFWIVPLLIWVLLGINNSFLGVHMLLGSGRDKEYSSCFQIGVICTVVINFVFVYCGEGLGAAWAPALSEAILSAILWNKVRKIAE